MNPKFNIFINAQMYNSLLYYWPGNEIAFCEKTIGLLQKIEEERGIYITYHDKQLLFHIEKDKYEKLSVQLCYDMPSDINGKYDYDAKSLIQINGNNLINPQQTYGSLVHEKAHDSQGKIADQASDLAFGSLEREFANMLKVVINKIDAKDIFDMRLDGQVYVDGTAQIGIGVLDGLNDAFYRLAITERYAFAAEKQYLSVLGKKGFSQLEPKERRYQSALETIIDRYDCDDYSEREICDLIDKTYYNIYHGKLPSTEIESMIMLDMIAALSHQKGYITHGEYAKFADRSYVSERLAQWNVEHPNQKVPFGNLTMSHTLDDNHLQYLDLSICNSPGKEVLMNNPKMLAYGIVANPDVVHLIPDITVFRNWCWSTDNSLSDEHMDLIANELGPKFSAKRCREEMKAQIRSEEQRKIIMRIANEHPIPEQQNYGHQNQMKTGRHKNIEHERPDR